MPTHRPRYPSAPGDQHRRLVPYNAGEGSVLHKAIVDFNCRVGRNVALVNKEGVYESFDRAVQGMYIRDGVIVLTRESVVPDGTVL
jgi:glucose-1-phosphate adenylyltransferase